MPPVVGLAQRGGDGDNAVPEGTVTITAVRAARPAAADGTPLHDWGGRQGLGQICVAVDTDDGLTGFGVCGGGEPGIIVIEQVLRPLLLGAAAADVEEMWEEMNTATLPYGRKGLAVMALSGVDLALWDLRAKRRGLPVAALAELGSDTALDLRVELPSYKTLAFPGREPTPADAVAAVAEGFSAIKLAIAAYDVRRHQKRIVDLVRSVRDAIPASTELMADAAMGAQRHLGWSDREAVLALCKLLEPFKLSWLEEPLPCDALSDYRWLCARTSVPIAAGEHEFTARGFDELLALDIQLACWQPDIAWCGGLTALLAIYRLGRRHGIRVCPHRGSEVWSLHAMVALEQGPRAATSAALVGPGLAESGRPWMEWVGCVSLDGGKARLACPESAGFGVVLPSVARQQ
jgi:L-rhamnonate dehydratase